MATVHAVACRRCGWANLITGGRDDALGALEEHHRNCPVADEPEAVADQAIGLRTMLDGLLVRDADGRLTPCPGCGHEGEPQHTRTSCPEPCGLNHPVCGGCGAQIGECRTGAQE